jgi:hypothetical protein
MRLPRMTIGRLMVVVLAVAVYFAVARYDSPCSPLSPILALLYLCGVLGGFAARWQGRRWQKGFWLGFLLGPIGVIVAGSNRIPAEWLEDGQA